MKPRAIALGAVLAALASFAFGGVALARNPHCAGGIQYVVQGMRDKQKGNTEDYQREMGKAVAQLTECRDEDPKDFEAIGYLGWAYAEIDSSRLAGEAFQAAIDGLTAKGDKKKAEWATNNRDSYWAQAFNDGISKINDARKLYPEFTKPAEGADEQSLKDQAQKMYETARTSLTRANDLKPKDPQTIRSLGSVYAYMGDYSTAEKIFHRGVEDVPGDTSLTKALTMVRTSIAGQLIDNKQFDQAVAMYDTMLAEEPNDASLHLGLADAYFRRAQGKDPGPRAADFKAAAVQYAAAAELEPNNADLPFNAALAYQNAGEWALAEKQWRAALEKRPEDTDAMSALGAALAELKRFDEAITVVHKAIMMKPKNKDYHRQLGAIYTKAGNNPKSTEELMVYLALKNGQPVADPAAFAKQAPAGSAAAKTLATMGVPDEIVPWQIENEKIDSWFYWSKSLAYHFKNGTLNVKSDWSKAETKSPTTVGAK